MWEATVPKKGQAFVAKYEVGELLHGTVELEMSWHEGRRLLGRDDEIALELLSDHLCMAVERLDRRQNGKRRRTTPPPKVVPLKRE